MRHRAGNEISHAGPLAPTWFFSSQPVATQKMIEMTKKGNVGRTSRFKRISPLFHQQMSSSTAGSAKAVVLANRAQTNRTNAKLQARQSRFGFFSSLQNWLNRP